MRNVRYCIAPWAKRHSSPCICSTHHPYFLKFKEVYNLHKMSPPPTSSRSISCQEWSPKSFVCIGPNDNRPDVILWPHFSQYTSYENKTRTGRYRSQVRGHPLNGDCDAKEVLGTLHDRLKPTIALLNQNRPATIINNRQRFKGDRATWQSEVEKHVHKLSKDSKDSKLTIILCSTPSEYAKALSKFSVGPFTEREEDLLNKLGLSITGVTASQEIVLQKLISGKTDTNPPSRTVKGYEPGHGYDSDPGSNRLDVKIITDPAAQ
jgi:hypothetical protein